MGDAINVSAPTEETMVDNNRLVYTIVVPSLITLCLLSFGLNAYILGLSVRLKRRLTPVLRLTFGLAAADCWSSIVIALGLICNSLVPYVLEIDVPICFLLVLEVLRMGGIFTSIIHLLLLALHHYLSIAYPHGHLLSSDFACYACMVCAWLLPPTGLQIALSSVPNRAFRTPSCSDGGLLGMLAFRAPIAALVIFPLIVMGGLYVAMSQQLQRMQNSLSMRKDTRRQSQGSITRKRRAMITTLLMVGTFVFAWLPSGTTYLLFSNEYQSYFPFLLVMGVAITCNTLMILKLFVNPIIYALRVPEIRDSLSLCGRSLKMGVNSTGSKNYASHYNTNGDTCSTYDPLLGSSRHNTPRINNVRLSLLNRRMQEEKKDVGNSSSNNTVNNSPAADDDNNHRFIAVAATRQDNSAKVVTLQVTGEHNGDNRDVNAALITSSCDSTAANL